MTSEGSSSNDIGAKDLKALGYDVEVDDPEADSTDSGPSVAKYALYLAVLVAVVLVVLFGL